tara:strand:- start:51447 stop:52934 length:1488 start_codon:yes stop_codon:yes gene_type:complete
MSYQKQRLKLLTQSVLITLTTLLTLTGCGSSSPEEGVGYFQVYNASSTAPKISLTVDQLANADYIKKTHSSVNFTKVSSRFEYTNADYDIELTWQDDNYDLNIVYGSQVSLNIDQLKFVVLAGDIKTPDVQLYDIPIRSEAEVTTDVANLEFNVRVLNVHSESSNLDLYFSKDNESFNEAQLLTQSSYAQLTDNQKIAQGSYIFYLTSAGSTEVLYNSKEISFPYSAEYILAIRQNQGAGNSPFVIDIITTSSVTEYADANSEAAYRIYNGIIEHELLPNYHSLVDLHVDGIDESAEVSSLAFSHFSDKVQTNFGDYSLTLLASGDNSPIIKNHLMTLSENSNKTIFFYLTQDNVDLDGDGDVDEDGDGYVDEIKITINSLVVNNSQSESVYTHQINVVNLIDSDDFSFANVYFVRSNEIIDTAEKYLTVPYISPKAITLNNNSYRVYIIININSSEHIIGSEELILNEGSKDQFLMLETDNYSPTGYKMTFTGQ